MATNKKLGGNVLILFLLTLLAGCHPTGPGALLKGKRLLEQGKYPAAIENLSVATQLLATNAQAWNYLGLAYHQAGQLDNAAEAYRKALKLDRDRMEIHYNLGCLLLEQNKPADASTHLTTFTLRHDKDASGWLKLGTAQLRLHDLLKAEKSFNEALRLGADNPEALNGLGLVEVQRNRQRDAVVWFNRALSKQPDYGPALLNLAVVAHGYANDPKLALQKYKAYLALNPRPANWDAVNATAKQLEQELTSAAHPPTAPPIVAAGPASNSTRPVTNVPARGSGVAVNPSRPEAITNPPPRMTVTNPTRPDPGTRAEAVKLPDAQPVKVADNVVSSPRQTTPVAPAANPARPAGLSTNSEAVSKSAPATAVAPGRYAYLSPAKPAAGNRAEAERLFAQAAQSQRDRRAQDAVTQYRAATQADPSFFDAQSNLGLAAYNLGDWAKALPAFETALAIRPDSFSTRFNFALALQKAGYLQDSAQELERLTAGSPAGEPVGNLATAHLTLAHMYATQFHRPAAARPHFLKVLELDPQNPEATSIRYWLRDNP